MKETQHQSSRATALLWWRGLHPQDQEKAYKQWRLNTSDHRKTWGFKIASSSSACIEVIHNYLNPNT